MTKTGPQLYPGASTNYWYGDQYKGAPMEINACVWHTTEGTVLPSYGGGAAAPTLTAVPDHEKQRLRWYQHFELEQSARALVDAAGGITTNRNNLCQVELVGTCDPATSAKWAAASRRHIYWPAAPDWALGELALFAHWLYEQHGVPLTSTVTWTPYPKSYGTRAAQRLTADAFNRYRGHLGHQHVPEGNDHGDPGNLDMNRILSLARTLQKDDTTMPTPAEIAAAVMDYQIDDPRTTGTKYVSVKSVLWWIGADAAQTRAEITKLRDEVTRLRTALESRP